jgi:ubiquitin-protein ligase
MDDLKLKFSKIKINEGNNSKIKQRLKIERDLLKDYLINMYSSENEFNLIFGSYIIRVVTGDSYPFKPPEKILIIDKSFNIYNFFDFMELNYNIYDKDSLKEINRIKDIVINELNWKPSMTIKYIFSKLQLLEIYYSSF